MKTIKMPKWVAVCLAVSALASMCLAALALTSYTLVKPFTLTITTAPCPLSVSQISFAYDPGLNQYISCSLQVANSGSPMAATVYVYLKNASAVTVAQGSLTQTFPSGNTNIVVALTWLNGATVDDVANGYVVIQPS
jgi:hypothetical protein